jgi:hypothetical protein
MKRPTNRSSRHKPKVETSPIAPAALPNDVGAPLTYRCWLLAGMTALFVARPLVPSEGVAWVGDGQTFCMLWLLLAMLTCFAALKAGCFPRRFDWLSALLVAFTVLYAAAALRGTYVGSPRPAINMLWEAVAMTIGFLLVRQLVRTSFESRVLIAVMIALAMVVSVFGLYQVFVSMPADRAEFARDPEGMLRRAGEWYPPDSPERAAFENRLASTEPLATFALTNSLAGFLLPWIVIAAGVTLGAGVQLPRIGMIVAVLLPGFCLLLTKSRSGYVALAMAIALLLCNRFRQVLRSKAAWIVIAVVLIALTATYCGGLIDLEIATEASKSLGYRLQYWQSTLAMIRDQPLLGVGPGNFQDYYTAYKLPEASEEIRDPHNWILEIASTAGIPAALLLLVLMIGAIAKLVRCVPPYAVESDGEPRTRWFMVAGAACGLPLASAIGMLVGLPLGIERLAVGFAVGALTVWLLRGWIESGVLSPRLLAVALFAILVHLLASGGMLFPGVAGSIWLLLALGLNLSEPRPVPSHRLAPSLALAACTALAAAQYLTGYSPVLRSQGALHESQDLQHDAQQKTNALVRAASADPRSATPWQELAALRMQQWLQKPGPRLLDQFRQAAKQFLALQPHSSSAYRIVGKWWSQMFERSGNPEHAQAAAEALTTAVSLYPTSAILRAERATALKEAGQPEKATLEARTALRLHEATPHKDKKLSEAIRKSMQNLAR